MTKIGRSESAKNIDMDRAPNSSKMKLCLAASGGGHLRQIMDYQPAWSDHDYFFLTEDTPLSRSLSESHPARFVEHFAFGQARHGAAGRVMLTAIRNTWRSLKIILDERPDVVITTGAGAVCPGIFFAWLFGARIVQIESFARFNGLSLSARLIAPFSVHKIVQSPKLLAIWPNAFLFDSLRREGTTQAANKKKLLFATVGATLPFDRMIQAVTELKARGAIQEDVVVQTGVGGLTPEGIKVVETLSYNAMHEVLSDAEIVVCHGGTGSLITALRHGCKVVAMPRSFELKEAYDNHQMEITAAFKSLNIIETADTVEELAMALDRVRLRPSVEFSFDPSRLTAHLQALLADWATRISTRQDGGNRSQATLPRA